MQLAMNQLWKGRVTDQLAQLLVHMHLYTRKMQSPNFHGLFLQGTNLGGFAASRQIRLPDCLAALQYHKGMAHLRDGRQDCILGPS